MILYYLSLIDDVNDVSSYQLNDENKKAVLFCDIAEKKVSENFLIIKNSKVNKFPKEISCLLNYLNNINHDDYYFLDFNINNKLENFNLFLSVKDYDPIFKNNYFFLNNFSNDISVCFANYRDQVLFSTRKNPILKHGFPLIIKGESLIFVLRFIKIFFDLNIFNYNIEGIFALILNLKYG